MIIPIDITSSIEATTIKVLVKKTNYAEAGSIKSKVLLKVYTDSYFLLNSLFKYFNHRNINLHMKIAILLRGHAYLKNDRFGYPMDARTNYKNINENLIQPIKELHPNTQVFFSTYHSPAIEEISEKLQPSKIIFQELSYSSQISTYKSGIDYLLNNEDFDAIVATRFDLNFLKNFKQWNIEITKDNIYFPWKEYYSCWKNHRRVGDAIHIIGRNACTAFNDALTICQLSKQDMHLLYYYLRLMHPSLHFIEKGYWDSNTLWGNRQAANPLYKIISRPKLKTKSNAWFLGVNVFKVDQKPSSNHINYVTKITFRLKKIVGKNIYESLRNLYQYSHLIKYIYRRVMKNFSD